MNDLYDYNNIDSLHHVIDSIVTRIEENGYKFDECYSGSLLSQAANEIREGIQLIESQLVQANNIQTFRYFSVRKQNDILFESYDG